MTKQSAQPLDTSPTDAEIVITDINDYDEEYACKGRYYGDGRILVRYNKSWLGVDPECYHPDDPKRLFIVKSGNWSRFRIRSVLLNSKAILKRAKQVNIPV